MKKIFIIYFVLLIFISNAFYVFATQKSKVITVKSLDHKIRTSGSGEDLEISDEYLVFTENAGVFKNTDVFLRFKFNSSDIQNELTVGKKYKITYYGWRIRIFSQYPNIVNVEQLESI